MNYLSPGVYVEEVPSAVKPIAGVGTSTAGFIGIVANDTVTVPVQRSAEQQIGVGDHQAVHFQLPFATIADSDVIEVRVNGAVVDAKATLEGGKAFATLQDPPPDKAVVTASRMQVEQAKVAPAGEVHLCTTFSEFTKA